MTKYQGLPYKIRQPDFIVGGTANPYMHRWYVIPRNRWFNIYLHHFLRSDDDRALHDHPWWNMSILLKGSYIEHVPENPKAWFERGDRHIKKLFRKRGAFYLRKANSVHRVELRRGYNWDGTTYEIPCWTLFITGPRIRDWGFWCPKGWVFWKNFVAEHQGGNEIGKGCDQ